MAKDKAPAENRTADCTKGGGERTGKTPAGRPSSGLSGAALEKHQASLADFVQVGSLVGGKRRGRKAAEDHDEATEEAALKRRNIREHQVVDGVHERGGRRGFGLGAHPSKRDTGQNCCIEAEASPASV